MGNETLVVLEEIQYPVSIDDIKAFKEKWTEVPELDAEAGVRDESFLEIRKAHLYSVKLRNQIEKKRKALKDPALQYGKRVDSIAKEYKTLLADTEQRLFVQRSKVEKYVQEKEQKRIDAEKERVRLIDEEINKLRMLPLTCIGWNSEQLTNAYSSIEVPDPIKFDDKIDLAVEVYKDIMHKLEELAEQAKSTEKFEAIQAEKEKERLAEQKIADDKIAKKIADIEAENAKLKKEQEQAQAKRDADIEAEKMKLAEAETKEFEEEQSRIKEENKIITLDDLKVAYMENQFEGILDAIINGRVRGVSYE